LLEKKLRKFKEFSVELVSSLAEIQTAYLRNANVQRYRYVNPLPRSLIRECWGKHRAAQSENLLPYHRAQAFLITAHKPS
jgi:hypothetical protein